MSGFSWRALGWRLVAAVFPERCAGCGEVILPSEGVCRDCRRKLSRIGVPVCPLCGREAAFCCCHHRHRHFERVTAPFYYDGVAANGVLRMKHSGSRVSARYYAGQMADTVRQYFGDVAFDGVVFVPSGRKTQRRRGFNAGQMVARALAQELQLPLRPVLIKRTENVPQKRLNAIERSGNVLGVFDLASGESVVGQTLLLADDIVTTGATLDECAKMLKIYGAEAVYAVTAAAARMKKEDDIVAVETE